MPGLRFEPVLIEGSPSLPAGGTTPPHGYGSFSLPTNPVDQLPGDPLSRGIRAAKVFAYLPNPRIAAAFRATRRLTLTAGGGIYGQPPDPQDLSPVFGNPTVRLSRAAHLSGGFSFKLRPTLTLEVIGFYKRFWDLVSRNENPRRRSRRRWSRTRSARPTAASFFFARSCCTVSSGGSPTR